MASVILINKTAEELTIETFNGLAEVAEGLLDKPINVNLIITGDQEVQSLNKEYRNIDATTDVLSFPYQDADFVGEADCLGDIVVSLDQIKRQAHEYGNSWEEELNKIFVHGALHLLGFDHQTDSDYEVMKKIEDKIISAFNKRN